MVLEHNISRPNVIVTTSWDDDDNAGLQLAERLNAHSLPGTFYVPTGQLGQPGRLAGFQLRELTAVGFEVGAHTVSHRVLTEIPAIEATREIVSCKQTLEQILGHEVVSFCYPKGRFNSTVIKEVRRAGYRGARTTKMLCHDPHFPAFEMPTTVQAYPHQRSNYLRNLARLRAGSALVRNTPELIAFKGWLDLGKKMFDRVLETGGVWHLYGHPWEIARLNLWQELEEMFSYISGRSGVRYATNGQLLRFMTSSVNNPELETAQNLAS